VAEALATAAPAPAGAPATPGHARAVRRARAPRVPLADSAARLATVPVADAAKDLYPACDEVAQYSSAVLRAIPLPSAVEAHVGQVERVAREALEKARQQGAASGSAEMAGA